MIRTVTAQHIAAIILILTLIGVSWGCASDPYRDRIDHPCDNKEIRCGDRCVDVDSDPDHCGLCGHACEGGEVCSQGACLSQCYADYEECRGGCFDVSVSAVHCGRCGNGCAGDDICWEGQCRGLECGERRQWPDAWLDVADDVVQRINEWRESGAKCGGKEMPSVEALDVDSRLSEAARCHSRDKGQNEFRGSEGSDGTSPEDRVQRAGYSAGEPTEIALYGQRTPQHVVDTLMEIEEYCRVVMDDELEDVGIGFAHIPGISWSEYWTLTFAGD